MIWKSSTDLFGRLLAPTLVVWTLGVFFPCHAKPRCSLKPASSWYTTITAGDYKLLFDEDADLAAEPQVDHARHGNIFTVDAVSFRISGPGGTCWASPAVGIVTMPIFVGDGHYLYISTYSGGDSYLFVVDARTCKTIWQSADIDVGMPTRTPYGFLLPGVGSVFVGSDCLPRHVR